MWTILLITPEGWPSGDLSLGPTLPIPTPNIHYAGKVAAVFSDAEAGLVGTANAATVDLADDPFLTGLSMLQTAIHLNISSGISTLIFL